MEEELEDIDALINDVEQVGPAEKRENGRTAAQIKIKTFANNFANIGNIGEKQRKSEEVVGQTILRKDGSGGETNGHICPPSPSPSPPPSVSRRKASKRSSTSGSRSTSGSPAKRRRAEPSKNEQKENGSSAKNSQNGLLAEEKSKSAFHKSCLFFPNDVQLTPKERVDVTFEVKELKDVNVGVEVKSCFSFSYDRSLLSATEQKQLVSCCLIDAKPSQTVFGGRVVAAFTNTQDSGTLQLAKGMKIGVCKFQLPKFDKVSASEQFAPMSNPCEKIREETARVNTGSIDSAACSTPPTPPFPEIQADTALTQASAEDKSGAQNENKKIVGIHADTSLLQKVQDIIPDSIRMKPVKTSLTVESSSNELTGGTLDGVSTTSWHLKEDSGNIAMQQRGKCVDGAKPVKVFPEDLGPSQSGLTAFSPHLQHIKTHNQKQHSAAEEIEEKKFDIKREDLKDVKCPDLFLENIRSGMPALDYLDPEICGFVDLYFAWCQAEGATPTSEEGDELLQQVSMLDVSLLELTKVLQDNWLSEEREENEWKEVFGQKFSLVQSEMLPEFGKIVKILLLDFRTTFDTKKPELCYSDADSVAKKVSLNELHIEEAEQTAVKEAVMANAEKQLQQLREENEKLVAQNEQMASFVAAKEHSSGTLHRNRVDKNDHRSSAASFFHDVLERQESDAKYKEEFKLIGAVGRVKDYLPKKHIFRVLCEDDDGMDILLASKSAEMFLGKKIQFDAIPLKDRHQKVFINERTRKGAYRVTKIYSSMLDDIDSERDLLSRLKREPSEGSSSLVSSSTDVVHKSKEKFEENMEREDTKEDYRRRRDVDVKWKIRRMPKDCSHYVVPRFCKFKQCDGKCGDQHEFTSLQHKTLLEDVGSYCFRFPKFTCHKVKCGYPHYSWISLCRMVTEGLTKRRNECMNEGPCSQSGCRQLSETLLKSFKLCRLPCDNERRCKLVHSLPSHLQLPEHCTAFLSDSCVKPDCKLPHIPFSNINEIFVQKKSALQLFCEQCYTEKTLKSEKERQKERTPEEAFSPTQDQDWDEKESWQAIREGDSKKRRRSSSSRSESERCPKQSIFSRLGGPPVHSDRESRSSPGEEETDVERERCDNDYRKYDFSKRLKELEDEICKMLEEKESIPLGQIPPKYNQMYKRQLVLADYGFQRGQLPSLVAAMDERLEITGEEKHRVVILRRPRIVKFSRSTFENNSKKMLQVQGTVKLKNLMTVYSQMFGNQHTLESYGFQNMEDVLKAGEHTFKVIEVGNEKVAKLRIGRKHERRSSRSQLKEEVVPRKSNEQRVVYMQQGRTGKGAEERRREDSLHSRRIEERREIERRVEARRGIKRDLDARKERNRDERDEPGEWRREKKGDEEPREGRKKRESGQKREGSGDKRSSRGSRSQSVKSGREDDDLIEDVVGDPDDQGELLQIMELAHMEQLNR